MVGVALNATLTVDVDGVGIVTPLTAHAAAEHDGVALQVPLLHVAVVQVYPPECEYEMLAAGWT
jgi:hypothetical protein